MLLAGLDLGTTGLKINVFENNILKQSFYKAYPSSRQKNEQIIDIEALKNAFFDTLKEILVTYPDLYALGITSFGEAFVLLDKDDNILYDCMLYSDPRGTLEAKEIKEQLGDEYLCQVTGQSSNMMFSINKIAYVKKNHPEIFAKVNKILLIEDYITYLLTGKRIIDYSLAARTQCFNIHTYEWDKRILDCVGVSESLFSTPVPTGTIAGTINQKSKDLLGFYGDLIIVAVAHDQIANVVGSGALSFKSTADGLGTCECITPIFNDKADINALAKYGYGMIPFSSEKKQYCCYALTNTAGCLMQWFRDTFYHDDKSDKLFDELNCKVSDDPSSIFVLPYFAGSGTPYNDSDIKGMIYGLHLGTTREEIYQGLLESLCYENRVNIEMLSNMGVPIDELYVSGGGSQNDRWLQYKANILGINVHQLLEKNAGSLGTILIMNKALGLPNNKTIKIKKTFYPDASYAKAYAQKYEEYKQLYQRMKGINV